MSLISAEKTGTNTYELEIAVSGEDLRAAADQVFKRRAKEITVPGFRKGKAPRKVIETMYGEGMFLQDAVDDLYPANYSAAVEEAGIVPVDRANVEILTLDKETGFSFKATVTVKPEMTIKDYKGVEAVKYIYEVKDENVEAEVKGAQERNARIIAIEDRAAQDGDTVSIDFEGFIDGEAFEGGKGEDFSLVLGSKTFIDTFEEQIVGHNIGDDFEVNVKFPDEYGNSEQLQGKPALFKVKLHEIKMKELPELDDEFAKDVSEFDTLDEYKADIKARLTEAMDKRANDEVENAILDKIIGNLEGEIPEVMFENRIDEMMQEFDYRLQSQGMDLEIYLQYTGMDADTFRVTFREQAQHQVKVRLALEAIAELENLEATEEDIEKKYASLAEMYQMEAEQAKTFFPEKDLMADIKAGKAVDFVRNAAKLAEEPAPEPELHDHDHDHDHEGHDHDHAGHDHNH